MPAAGKPAPIPEVPRLSTRGPSFPRLRMKNVASFSCPDSAGGGKRPPRGPPITKGSVPPEHPPVSFTFSPGTPPAFRHGNGTAVWRRSRGVPSLGGPADVILLGGRSEALGSVPEPGGETAPRGKSAGHIPQVPRRDAPGHGRPLSEPGPGNRFVPRVMFSSDEVRPPDGFSREDRGRANA